MILGSIEKNTTSNAALKRNASELDFINRLSAFISISFGSTEVGFSYYFGVMALEVEKNMGIDTAPAHEQV